MLESTQKRDIRDSNYRTNNTLPWEKRNMRKNATKNCRKIKTINTLQDNERMANSWAHGWE